MGSQQAEVRTVEVPLGAARQGRLCLTPVAERVDVVADGTVTGLCEARLSGHRPEVTADGGTVRLRYPRLLRWGWGSPPALVRLNPTLPWSVEIDGGAQHLSLDLRAAAVSGIAVRGGAGSVEVRLPRPRGTVTVSVGKGVHDVSVLRPRGVAVRVYVRGGASRPRLDDLALETMGGPLHWHSPDFPTATDRYDIAIGGGASGLVVGVGD